MLITLYKFGPFLGAPDSSPFVVKTMMLLKLAGLDYREIVGNPLKAPKKLLPYIDDDGLVVADSTLIRFHIEKKYEFDFDAKLTPEQKAIAWAVERMCEDNLYFAMLESRWLNRANFRKGVGTMFGIVPLPLRPIAKSVLRKANAKRLTGHGIGRHATEQIGDFGVRDIRSLSALLGSKPYLTGDAPCGADATVFGFVTSTLTPPLESPMRTALKGLTNLVSYCDRLTALYFPDSEEGATTPPTNDSSLDGSNTLAVVGSDGA